LAGKIVKVSGPLVVATGLADANMSDVVRVGPQRLIGEILTMKGDTASIQVYEETSGLGPGAEVETTGAPMSVELAPGMIEGIYDGIQRPLEKIVEKVGANITRGVEVSAVDHEKKWEFTATAKVGDKVVGGDILGTVPETSVVLHKIMVPPNVKGTITDIKSGSFNVTEQFGTLKTDDGREVPLQMLQKWPVRVGRPYEKKYPPTRPLPRASASSTRSSRSPRAVRRRFPARSARARRSCSTSSPSGRTSTSSSTSAAASAATR
jgi:V/A-type H+-transporting ATPase subunit A